MFIANGDEKYLCLIPLTWFEQRYNKKEPIKYINDQFTSMQKWEMNDSENQSFTLVVRSYGSRIYEAALLHGQNLVIRRNPDLCRHHINIR